MNTAKIKICGLFRPCDADYINEALPDYAGFVFFQKSHRFVTERRAMLLRANMVPSVTTVGVFVNHDPSCIKRLYENRIVSVIQLHGGEDEDYIARLRTLVPGAEIWKAFKIRSAADLTDAGNSSADRVLLDNGCGTGECFDWSVAANFGSEMVLAGGLNPENIRVAIKRFHPFAVDISSGVETEKIKDKAKILAAVAAARG
ncbi:MAG: phosphoribosylanthranilate isomerase [Oscillospiraceae bacterium]